MNTKLFLSAVSSEFESYRKLLAADLKRDTLDVAVQENFAVGGGLTLEKLDDYVRACDGVVHLIGKATGDVPPAAAVKRFVAQRCPDLGTKLPCLGAALQQADPCFSYTQWEAYLAIYRDRPVFIYRSIDFKQAVRAQRQHYERLCQLGRDRGQFANEERLSSAVLRDLVDILPALRSRIHVPPTRLRHTARVLIGRESELTMLDAAWNGGDADPRQHVVVVRGKGGEGKTSLVAEWMAELTRKDWRGAQAVFDWSFYSQGTLEQSTASSDVFIHDALVHFGDHDPNVGSPDDRGARLAQLVGDKRALLVLDGLEPLQYPPGPMHGQLKDKAVAALLRGLAARNEGLCIVTSRERVDEIQQHYGKVAIDHDLEFLSPEAGAALLHRAGARRAGAAQIGPDDDELKAASREVRGHALTLFLVGQYLGLVESGDIRRRDCIGLAEAEAEYKNDPSRSYGHAFKAIEAYEQWLGSGDAQARRQLVVLRLLGLFDRPASASCLVALREAPSIVGLTEGLIGATATEWKLALARLVEIDLAEVGEDGSVDCHPLVRDYFAQQLRAQKPDAFRAGHSRLFDHLCANTPHRPNGLAGLQPLYQAVVHGCLAERQQEACDEVYFDRILRDDESYSMRQLGAAGADLGAVSAFFEAPWSRLSPNLDTADQAWLLSAAATRLRALGRLTEALEPIRLSLDYNVRAADWVNAAICASNLSELELTLGRVEPAVADARRSIEFADRSMDAFESREALQKVGNRTTAADTLHHAGRREEAEKLFAEAERMQEQLQPKLPRLYSLQGFRYADLLLGIAERAAWQVLVAAGSRLALAQAIAACHAVHERATQTLEWARAYSMSLLSIGLDHLTLARAGLYRTILAPDAAPPTSAAGSSLPNLVTAAVAKLREANVLENLPQALLTATFHAATVGHEPGQARHYLDEAQQIAERGPMPLYLADVHLHRARLFQDRRALNAARDLIHEHGYGRRLDELADAEAAATKWPA